MTTKTDKPVSIMYQKSEFYPGTQYIHADLVRAAMPANWKEDPEWVALAEALEVKE